MYRLVPLRTLRNTARVKFHEMVPSDIPKVHGIDRVIHEAYATSPGPVDDCPNPVQRPWYMHPAQDDNLLVLHGERFIDVYCVAQKTLASFIVTPEKIYKNNKLYHDSPAMIVWPAGIFHRIVSGSEGSISVNFSTRTKGFDLSDNFNVYDLDTTTGNYRVIREGKDDQPDLSYVQTDNTLKEILASR
ncbi:MAG: hypothetical protein CBC12_07280 [Candidatus Puniceispirillum sp. TMED52]|jgi:hypothetical protein|nr:MAG: hypothetical protein CBC12_07280 [Candidatus Puniceispirillum sp. TMED52]RPF82006.1 MAG: hypothetical protein CBC65_001340 [Rhodothermaceae bacterium TMED105]